MPLLPDAPLNVKSKEARYGITWEEVSGYKERISFPLLPDAMPAEVALLGGDVPDCVTPMLLLDRCVLFTEREIESERNPSARLAHCRAGFHTFRRCVTRRDALVLRNVKRWESGFFFHQLHPDKRSEYVQDVDRKARYHEYLAARETDPARRLKLRRLASDCAGRRDALAAQWKFREAQEGAKDALTEKKPQPAADAPRNKILGVF